MGNTESKISEMPIGGTPEIAPGSAGHTPNFKTRPHATSRAAGAEYAEGQPPSLPTLGVNEEPKAKLPTREADMVTPKPMEKKFEKPKEVVPSSIDVHNMTQAEKDQFDYKRLRDDLFAFSLGEAAYQYANRLNRETPNNPALMALLGETAYLYEKLKNKGRREHWVDRIEVLQHGIDVSRKCMDENPDYGPCWRSYVLCVAKMSDTEIFFKRWKPLSLFKNYNRLQAVGDHALELQPDADTAMCLAAISGRCATRVRHWYSPWNFAARYYNLPYQRDLLKRAEHLLELATEAMPENIEMQCRLAEVEYELGDWAKARRLYVKVRDEMTASDPGSTIWQAVAHTHLISHFDKPEWNLPFG